MASEKHKEQAKKLFKVEALYQKTPKTFLYEIAQRSGITLDYQISPQGPPFECKLKFPVKQVFPEYFSTQPQVFQAAESSKKNAQQVVAENAVKLFRDKFLISPAVASLVLIEKNEENQVEISNYVIQLQNEYDIKFEAKQPLQNLKKRKTQPQSEQNSETNNIIGPQVLDINGNVIQENQIFQVDDAEGAAKKSKNNKRKPKKLEEVYFGINAILLNYMYENLPTTFTAYEITRNLKLGYMKQNQVLHALKQDLKDFVLQYNTHEEARNQRFSINIPEGVEFPPTSVVGEDMFKNTQQRVDEFRLESYKEPFPYDENLVKSSIIYTLKEAGTALGLRQIIQSINIDIKYRKQIIKYLNYDLKTDVNVLKEFQPPKWEVKDFHKAQKSKTINNAMPFVYGATEQPNQQVQQQNTFQALYPNYNPFQNPYAQPLQPAQPQNQTHHIYTYPNQQVQQPEVQYVYQGLQQPQAVEQQQIKNNAKINLQLPKSEVQYVHPTSQHLYKINSQPQHQLTPPVYPHMQGYQ